MATEQTSTKKKTRSASYPATNLSKAIENTQLLQSNLGQGPFSRESAVKAIGYSGISGTSATAIAALVHYGLVTRSGDTYSISPLTEQIVRYRDEGEKKASIVQAALNPKLFTRLFEAYSGKSLPSMLSHILVRDYGIGESVSGDVVRIFTETMTWAELLQHGVLSETVTPSQPAEQDVVRDIAPQETITKEPQLTPTPLPPIQGQFISMEITPGLSLSYPADRAFELFTDSEFVEALKTLKERAESKSEQAS